jgi:hypothetical protein
MPPLLLLRTSPGQIIHRRSLFIATFAEINVFPGRGLQARADRWICAPIVKFLPDASNGFEKATPYTKIDIRFPQL